jgi:hypothetical protein
MVVNEATCSGTGHPVRNCTCPQHAQRRDDSQGEIDWLGNAAAPDRSQEVIALMSGKLANASWRVHGDNAAPKAAARNAAAMDDAVELMTRAERMW